MSGSAEVQRLVAHDATEAAGLLASAQARAAALAARLSRSHSTVAVLESEAAAGNVHLREMQARALIEFMSCMRSWRQKNLVTL